jgi:hypothetical protein
VLPAGEHDPTESDHVHFTDGVTDDRKGILPDLTIGGDVIRRVDVAVINLVSRNELIDLDGPRALDLNGLEFFVLNDEVLPFSDLVTARDVLPGDHLARFGVDILLLQAVSSLPVNPIETYFFAE